MGDGIRSKFDKFTMVDPLGADEEEVSYSSVLKRTKCADRTYHTAVEPLPRAPTGSNSTVVHFTVNCTRS